MKKLKKLELHKMNLHPNHKLNLDDMGHIHGGWGCICDDKPFNLNYGCACNENKFGFCSQVNGGGPGPGYGCSVNLPPYGYGGY